MKIAHVQAYFQPKLGYQEFYLASEQQKMGHEVRVITSDRYASYPDFSRTVGKILGQRYVGKGTFMEEGLKVIRLPLLFEIASNNFLLGLKKALADFSPDIVHAHGATTPTTIATIIFEHSLHCKVVVDCHMDYSLEAKSKIKRIIFHAWSKNPACRWVIKKADGYITVAESARRWLSREWGISADKIEVIPLGAESNLFSPNISKRRNMRKRLGVGEQDVLIVYAGKLVPEKDIEILLHAAAPLIDKHRNVKVLLIGNGPKEYMSKLLQLVDKYKIRRNVLFYPFQHKTMLPKYYNAGDVGVWPGQDSITIVEAMATGLPIIIPRSYRNFHYIENSNGFNFTRGNSEELQKYLEQLIADEQLRHKMSINSRQLVERKLSWNTIAKQTLDLYYKILV
jgi:glycosyltransferase involved in cell wall biosynthesis